MKLKQFYLVFIILMTEIMPCYGFDQFESMAVGETKTFYFPSEVTSRASSITTCYCYSDHINNIDILEYTTSYVKVKALAYTPSRVAVQFYYSWSDNGTPRNDIHTVNIDLNDDSHSNSDPDLNPRNYTIDYGSWGTIDLEQGKDLTVSCLFDIPDKKKVKSIVWSDHQEMGGGNYFGYSIVSQSNTACIIHGYGSIYNQRLYCLMKYGSNTYKAYYIVNITPSTKKSLELTANPNGGSIEKGTKVSLTSTSGATIYYTLNGNKPTTSSSTYTSSGITVNESCTLRAFAKKSGYNDSPVMTWYFTVKDTPENSIAINEENFPDKNFRNYLLSLDIGKDGKLSEKEISDITSISVYNKEISNLRGIEYFTSLKTLNCQQNYLTVLDLSKNTELESVTCNRNELTSLNVLNNKELSTLICDANKLIELDVSKNPKLTRLDCRNNQLASLDVSKNINLESLDCGNYNVTDINGVLLERGNNQIRTLDISMNTALTYLRCDLNLLTSLDVSKNTALTYLSCFGNLLTSLDVSKNTGLTRLNCSANRLTSLDVSKNTILDFLGCRNNQLTALDVSKNTALTLLDYCINKIKEKAMDSIIQSLPTNKTEQIYKVYVYHSTDTNEGNVFTKAHASAAKAKGWTPLCYDGSDLVECDGHDPITVQGDVNGDKDVNGTDLVSLTNIIMGRNAETSAADVNKDGKVNGTDYVTLANIVLGRNKARTRAGSSASLSIEPFDIKAGETKQMVIDLSNQQDEITLVQFDLRLPNGLTLKETAGEYDYDIAGRTTWRKHSLEANKLSDGSIRFLLASSSNAKLEGSSGAIISMTIVAGNNFSKGQISLENILLVTPDEKETKPANVVLGINQGTDPEPVTELAEGVYYIKNVGTGKYITNGGHWGTHIAIDNRGLDLNLEKSGSQWKILSGFTSEGALGKEGYVDNTVDTDLTITKQGEGIFTIAANDGSLLYADAATNFVDFVNSSTSYANARWMFIPESTIKAERMASLTTASENNPVDATFLIANANINNARDERIKYWDRNCGTGRCNYGIWDIDTEPIMEVFRSYSEQCSDPFSVSQVIELVPGYYKLEAQGFYRDGDYAVAADKRTNGTEEIHAYLFAGDDRIPLKSIFTEATQTARKGFSANTTHGFVPNTITEAGYCFQSGLYNNELFFAVPDNGASREKIEIGIRGEQSFNYNNWTAFDNFQLTYYGTSASAATSPLSIEPFSIKAGEEKQMVIDLTNPDDDITLVQFDLRLPTGLSLKKVGGEYDFDIAGRTSWRKHSLDANDTNGIIRFLLSSSSNTVLEGHDGAIIKMTLVADSHYNNGAIKLENILLVTPDEKESKPSDVVFIPTGIVNINVDEQSAGYIYTLSGQRIAVPRKGINIINGKKIIVR